MKVEVLSMDYEENGIAKRLIKSLDEAFKSMDGYIFYRFPVIKEMDEPVIQPDVFVIAPGLGISMIFCGDFEKEDTRSYRELCDKADKADAYVYSALVKHKNLQRTKRVLNFEITTLKYLPVFIKFPYEDGVFTDAQEVCKSISAQMELSRNFTEEHMQEVMAHLEAATATIKPKERHVSESESGTKAAVLKHVENQIAKFDDKQRFAALALIEGPMRIRGLAGSGKTIILCLKAAYLHMLYPDKTIVYTFYTKSLYDYIHKLITRFYLKISDGQLPDFENSISIMHAWGGKNVPGVYYQACKENGVLPLTYRQVLNSKDQFGAVCNDFLMKTHYRVKKSYDYIIMDEAQDFPASFYQLCRAIVKADHLIWGYDELQNIFDVQIQNTEETFRNEFDQKGLKLEKYNRSSYFTNDIVLNKSYRNMKEILVTAISIGFGIYNDKLVQSLMDNNHWKDYGFQVVEGDCSREEEVKIVRPDENSPLAVPERMNRKDIIEFYDADNAEDEAEYVCREIEKAIYRDKLRPDDIAVISLDDRFAKNYFEMLQERLVRLGIATNNILDKSYVKGFSLEDYVTLSSVYKAKGNEAAMIFVMGCDVFDKQKDSRSMRNRVFTAFTRAKVWLRISGIHLKQKELYREICILQQNNYELHFANVSSYKLDRDWKKAEKDQEQKNEFLNELYNLIESSGLNEKEALSLIREEGLYEIEKNE